MNSAMATIVIILNLISTQRDIKHHIQFNMPKLISPIGFCRAVILFHPYGNKTLRHSEKMLLPKETLFLRNSSSVEKCMSGWCTITPFIPKIKVAISLFTHLQECLILLRCTEPQQHLWVMAEYTINTWGKYWWRSMVGPASSLWQDTETWLPQVSTAAVNE